LAGIALIKTHILDSHQGFTIISARINFWIYSGWIYNYLCNQCLSPLMLWAQISIRARCTTLCNKVC